MLNPSYPNLELLEYKVRLLLNQTNSFKEAVEAVRETNRFASAKFEANMFPQLWPNTATGFDVNRDGSPAICGQAFTAAYTTVFHETLTNSFVVCFGNEPCYFVTNPTDAFFEDQRNHNMVSLSKAKERY